MIDDHAALAYLSNLYGPGRFRLTPRSEHGTKLPGTQSLIAMIDEDTSMHVTMNSAANLLTPAPISGIDGVGLQLVQFMTWVPETIRPGSCSGIIARM